MLRFSAVLLILFLKTSIDFGQTSDFAFEHLGAEQGLSNLNVTSIYQDSKGFMWFGTFNGLNRYDGYEMKNYFNNPKDSLSLSDNRITCIYEDNKKNLWIGTNVGGLNLYNSEKNNFIRYTKEATPKYQISANRIETIYQDTKGNLWVGTNDGLNIYDYKTSSFQSFYKHERDPSSINSSQVYSVIENQNKELLVLTNETELNKYSENPNGFLHFSLDHHNELLNTARFIFPDKENDLWIGTRDNGLLKYHNGVLKQYWHDPKNNKSISHNLIRSILKDDQGNIWVGTDGGGLNIYNSAADDFTQIKADEENKNGLSSNAVYSLFQDNAGIIWIGTFGGGINTYHREKSKFKNFTSNPHVVNSLSNRSVLSLLEDSNGAIWIGTDGGGLNRFDRKTNSFTHYRHNPNNPNSLSSDVVKSIYEDKKGNLWIGTYLGGLDLFDRASNKFYSIKSGTGNASIPTFSIIWFIYEDSRNNLWLSMLGNGLCIYNRDKKNATHFQPFAGEGSLGDYNIFSILEDSQGDLWIGTEDHGINIYDYQTGTFSYKLHNADDERSLSSDHAWVLFEDSNKNMWVGTGGGGLNLYDRKTKTFEHYTTEDGLPSNIIHGILEDSQGNLWITTNKGLSKFNPQKKTFKNYDVKDGLQSNDFNTNAAMASNNGDLFIGGLNGFNIFTPNHLKDNRYIPPVVLTDFLIFNKSVKIGGEDSILKKQITDTDKITISYKESVISFKFAALNFISAEKNQYAYMMEGFEENWNYKKNAREVTYTNLDPGTYTFKVKATNNDGLWNEEGTSITLIITPPWWETFWFRSLFFIVIISSAITFYKIRTNKIRKEMIRDKLRELLIKEAQMREERLQHEKDVIELSKSKLEAEVQFKNAELATSVMNVVKQNETLLKIKEDITQSIKEENREVQVKQIKRIVKHIDLEVKPDQNWDQFEQLFNQIHENFLQKLKERFPELTSRDLKLCAYLRMNLNSKEIAPLLSLSVRGVEDLRYRVRKKMGLDTSVNLAEFILSL
jgi:ligand-binding sensor domain-containing protein/DNA-binding CsgD family transcriptional regulator